MDIKVLKLCFIFIIMILFDSNYTLVDIFLPTSWISGSEAHLPVAKK